MVGEFIDDDQLDGGNRARLLRDRVEQHVVAACKSDKIAVSNDIVWVWEGGWEVLGKTHPVA